MYCETRPPTNPAINAKRTGILLLMRSVSHPPVFRLLPFEIGSQRWHRMIPSLALKRALWKLHRGLPVETGQFPESHFCPLAQLGLQRTLGGCILWLVLKESRDYVQPLFS
jgi:hypothetical protein